MRSVELRAGRFLHGSCGHDRFLPLYVFGGDHLVVAYLSLPKVPSGSDWPRLGGL